MPVEYKDKRIPANGFISTVIFVAQASQLDESVLKDLSVPDPEERGEANDKEEG